MPVAPPTPTGTGTVTWVVVTLVAVAVSVADGDPYTAGQPPLAEKTVATEEVVKIGADDGTLTVRVLPPPLAPLDAVGVATGAMV